MNRLAERTWFRDHLIAYRLGLLSPEEKVRFEASVTSDPTCRAALDEFGAADPEAPPPDEHLPAALVAAWPRAQRTLRGFERAMAREHLQGCERCRAEIQFLGFQPELAISPGMEAESESAAPERRAPVLPKLVESARTWRDGLFPRLAYSWSALATAAAILLFVRLGGVERQLDLAIAPRLDVSPAVEVTVDPVRRDVGAPVQHEIPAGTAQIVFKLPAIAVPEGASVRIEISMPAGRTVEISSLTDADVDRALEEGLRLDAGRGGLQEGEYQVYLVTDGRRERWGDPIRLRFGRP
jgi:anti-sigma factor RsiW